MNPEEVFTKQELNEIKEIGVNIENRIYTPEECGIMVNRINENIMSESKKDIPNRINNLSNVLTTLKNSKKFQKKTK